MFESALLEKLLSDSDLLDYTALFDGEPAIFSEFAPEKAPMPYIVFKISRNAAASPAVQEFSILIDYFDYNNSAKNSREAVERIEFILDRAELEHDRYSKIRIFFSSGASLEEADPRTIHYKMQFIARAGRKKWMKQL
jgi:hypothetical protein